MQLQPGGKIGLWLPAICKLKFDLQEGTTYHLQGRDGNKFVLDHNAHVELWPENTAKECRKKVRQQCIKEPCAKYGTRKQKKACEKKRKAKCEKDLENCEQFLPFETYVDKLKDGGQCESRDICQK